MTPETDSRPPAPEPLRLVQEFVNTRDIEDDVDRIGSPDGLASWLAEQGLSAGESRLRREDVAGAVELREGLRGLLRANAGRELDPAAVAAVNRAGEHSALRMHIEPTGEASLDPASRRGVSPALGRILATMYAAMADGTWERLKVCRAEDCEWAFYDRSKNRSGQWCEMAVCGCRNKVRAFRARQGGSAA